MAQPRAGIITTARTKSHMGEEEVAALREALQPHMPTAAWLKNPPQPLEVEVGMGNGLALAARAKVQPERHFLGIEVYLNGLRTLRPHLKELPNVRVSDQDARALLPHLPAASVQRIVIPHPDPWPKFRHAKRRLVNPDFLKECGRLLASNGELWVVTDWPDYAFHTIAELYKNKAFTLAQTEPEAARCKTNAHQVTGTQNLLSPKALATPPDWWVPTKYGQKALALGREAWFICAFKKA